ncbi:MAG: DNRLRE domain-containing protein, partial [Candidatus Hodarchaeaceae archaeon]|nr:DNRLRE domain-containing protein [Candidatus Hodarchaeaceae archaeon]
MYVGRHPTYGREWAYLKFDLSEIPDGAIIESATMRLAGRYGPSRPDYTPENMTVSVWKVNDDSWEEETLTWNNRPGLVSEITRWVWRPHTEVGRDYVWSLDVTSYVNSEFAGDKIVSIGLKSENEDKDIAGWFYTKDAAEDQPRPCLLIQGTGLY